jgi:hypothetical protein
VPARLANVVAKEVVPRVRPHFACRTRKSGKNIESKLKFPVDSSQIEPCCQILKTAARGASAMSVTVLAMIKSAQNLLSLNATPRKSQILYHYCNPIVFWSIVEKGHIWLSDIFTMRDWKELKWGRDIFTQVVRENHGLFDDDFRYFATFSVFGVDNHVRPFVASFSANGDLLSQWRAYGDDGRGFSLGVRAHHIYSSWGVRLKKVEYREVRQKALVLQSLVELQDLWRKRPQNLPSVVSVWQDVLNEFAIDLCSFKHPSFFEEKEFRIVRVLLYSNGEYSDVGGHTDVGGSGRVPTKTRFRGSEEISYIELPRDENRQDTMIAEVIMAQTTSKLRMSHELASKARGITTLLSRNRFQRIDRIF